MHSQPGSVPPVFVDGTGRRRRLTVIAGTAMGLGLLTSLVLIAAGLFLDTSVPLPGWSEDSRGTRPVEAGVDGVNPPRLAKSPSPAGRTSAPLPRATPTSDRSPTTAGTTATATGTPSATDQPGRGDEHRKTAKPSRSPGKPQ
ncbi:hypothetical protein PSH03_001186 [Micromonospora sp. PSH03]|uniref:hypothetical protein n=1 Tax=Micromonospora TaxID=1873 RepID=UPI001B377955|nr:MULTISPECIES: hypothetical protein [Micromonospora]MBQ0992672.1 hypothetical protein [Micromonospora sp. H61]MCG5456295.1 hypothetical protein [Micromonospora salmantinae]